MLRFTIKLLGQIGLLVLVVSLLVACGESTETPISTPTPLPTAAPAATTTPGVRTLRAPTLAAPTTEPGLLAQRTPASALPAWQAYQERLAAALQLPIPVLRLSAGMSDEQLAAQELALQDPRMQSDLYAADGSPLRNEIFGVYAVHADDITPATTACQSDTCYRVELYNFAYNSAAIAFVDLTTSQVLDVVKSADMQPDIPPELTQLAAEIAINAPEVIDALGSKPAAEAAMMPNTKSALSQTRCERSRHLCVAPTFLSGERALWAIVDLTEGALVGVRWTTVGTVQGPVISEKQLQDEVVAQQYCNTVNTITRDGWRFDYVITSSDGLRISNVLYADQPRFDSVAVVDWHVSYSTRDGFGYSDAIGCPTFSQAAVVAFNGPRVEAIKEGEAVVGFALVQEFRSELWPLPCNYFYQNRYEFYNDGRFRPVMINLGRGCGNDGWYRPVLRIAFSGNQTLAAWTGDEWQPWTSEQWQGPSGTVSDTVTTEGYQFRVTDDAGIGYYVEPGRGQFDDGGRGDSPFVYVTKRHVDRNEGDVDLITIGSCCNTDYQQGPEKFIDTPPESIADTQIVLWYVAQMKNDDQPGQQYCWAEATVENGIYIPHTYPCAAGPLLAPVGQ
ncbi:MAG: hypothetical protein R3C14_16345 [Caldilineaceae bacterium]